MLSFCIKLEQKMTLQCSCLIQSVLKLQVDRYVNHVPAFYIFWSAEKAERVQHSYSFSEDLRIGRSHLEYGYCNVVDRGVAAAKHELITKACELLLRTT